MTTTSETFTCWCCNETFGIEERTQGLCASCNAAFYSVARCAFCGGVEGMGKGKLVNPPNYLPHVLMHEVCLSETRRGGLD